MTAAGHRRATALASLAFACSSSVADDAPWPVAGMHGTMRYVIVPVALAADEAAHRRQIDRLCEPDRTCFVNFYTNSTGAPVALPLPDAIDREATAVYRRSAKQGVERLSFSCRLQLPRPGCF